MSHIVCAMSLDTLGYSWKPSPGPSSYPTIKGQPCQDILISYNLSEDEGQAFQAQGQRTFLTASQKLIFHICIPPFSACDTVHTKNPEDRKPQSSTTGSAQTWPSLASEEVDYLRQQTNLPFCSGGDMSCLPRVFATNPDQMPSVPLLRRHAETQETLEDCPNRNFQQSWESCQKKEWVQGAPGTVFSHGQNDLFHTVISTAQT